MKKQALCTILMISGALTVSAEASPRRARMVEVEAAVQSVQASDTVRVLIGVGTPGLSIHAVAQNARLFWVEGRMGISPDTGALSFIDLHVSPVSIYDNAESEAGYQRVDVAPMEVYRNDAIGIHNRFAVYAVGYSLAYHGADGTPAGGDAIYGFVQLAARGVGLAIQQTQLGRDLVDGQGFAVGQAQLVAGMEGKVSNGVWIRWSFVDAGFSLDLGEVEGRGFSYMVRSSLMSRVSVLLGGSSNVALTVAAGMESSLTEAGLGRNWEAADQSTFIVERGAKGLF